jgi:nicotinamide-nucleotide amidase
METLLATASRIGNLLRERGETIVVAESSAGGLVAAALLAQPGASAYFAGGSILYTRKAITIFLDLPAVEVERMRTASEPYALDIARRLRERIGATWALTETGAAGPRGNSYGDPAGYCCVAISGPMESTESFETGLNDRIANMRSFALAALGFLERQIGRL